jgi:YbgC/YbaW family acyl-CoA thioester hydrolase
VIDRNNHVHHSRYLDLFEEQRAKYLVDVGMSLNELADKFSLRAFIPQIYLEFKKPVKFEDQVVIATSAEVVKATILFRQRLLKGDLYSFLWCSATLVDEQANPKRLPSEAVKLIQIYQPKSNLIPLAS